MIQKALLTTLAALLLYSALIFFFHHSITRTGQTVGQRNLVKAEEYRYEAAGQYDSIIVGSSMSERIVMDSMGRGCYNLAMAGLSSDAGLQLIQTSHYPPKLLYVESNTLLSLVKPADLPTGTDSPTWQLVQQYLPFMRQKYQPVGVFKALLRDLQYGKAPFVYQETGNQVDTAFLEKAIVPQLEIRRFPMTDSLLQSRMHNVWTRLIALKKQGTRIVLFEMPVDRRIQELASARTAQAALLEACRANDIPFIIPPVTDVYQTTDGIHLTNPACVQYTHYLCQELRKRGVWPASGQVASGQKMTF